MRIVVTGAAGLIGSHLCDALIADGHTVMGIDNLQTGQTMNLARVIDHPKFSLEVRDISTPWAISGFGGKIDQIYNLACPASPVHYQTAKVQTLKTCVLGAINVLELAQRHGGTVLQASTSEVYGDPLEHPQTESYWGNVNPIGVRSCYDEGKRAAESLFESYRLEKGIDTKIARIFNTYGERMAVDDGRVISNFVVAALRGEPLVVYGDGEQTRSFCHVSDTVAGLIALMNKEEFAGPVNIGDDRMERSINWIAEQILGFVDDAGGTTPRSEIVHADLPQDEPVRRRPDIRLAKAVLNWEPILPGIEYGLAPTVEWFMAVLSGRKDFAVYQ
jgi:UDP-glucuronate decarboxylase